MYKNYMLSPQLVYPNQDTDSFQTGTELKTLVGSQVHSSSFIRYIIIGLLFFSFFSLLLPARKKITEMMTTILNAHSSKVKILIPTPVNYIESKQNIRWHPDYFTNDKREAGLKTRPD
jgi:hypothetical protein